jgi:plastocyanin
VSIIPGAASYATGYDPDNITVVIGVNNTVIWTNNDNEPHTVTAADGSFDSGNMNPGATFTYTFTRPGIYTYICTYHPWMHGYVTVIKPS